jgi:ATP-binding protein involved in chromosome partitioning
MTQSAATAGAIRAKLSTYVDPYLGQTLEQAKAIGPLTVKSGAERDVIDIELTFGFPVADYAAELLPALESYLQPELGGAAIALVLKSNITAHAVQKTLKPLANVKNVIAVASGKGGVGKSASSMRISTGRASR